MVKVMCKLIIMEIVMTMNIDTFMVIFIFICGLTIVMVRALERARIMFQFMVIDIIVIKSSSVMNMAKVLIKTDLINSSKYSPPLLYV